MRDITPDCNLKLGSGDKDRPTLSLRGYALLTALLMGALCAQALAADFQTGVEAFERGDFAAALDEWRPLAERGLAEAQNNLGLIYDKGKGVPEDYTEAVKWYRKAAEQGKAGAQSNLGATYAHGWGVPQDYAEAVKWYRKAAEQGSARAHGNLGAMYYLGQGLPEDDVQPYAWLNIAVAQGEKNIEAAKKIIAESMTGEELARAQELSREYWEKYVLPFRN